MPRAYHLGRRQAAVERTAQAILQAARELVAEQGGQGTQGSRPSVGAVARRAGVSRLTVYGHFRNRAALVAALAPARVEDADDDLRPYLARSCAAWAENPGLYRHLPAEDAGAAPRRIAEHLAATDALRPGCSLKEAEDVIAALGSFAVFDRLHNQGRRSPAAVTEVLMRLAAGILA